jgi:hypothetical protein
VDTWATVAVAIGTIGTVIYALFRDYFVTARRRPRLELRFDRTSSDQVILGTENGPDAAHVRMRVANQKGKDTADEVVVMVTELRRLADREPTVETRPVVLPLAWSGSSPPLAVASVHPGSERHVDLLQADGSGDVPLRLGLSQAAAPERNRLDPGTHEISVEVRARNADAIRYTIGVSWDGTLPEAETVWDHLRVEPPRELH